MSEASDIRLAMARLSLVVLVAAACTGGGHRDAKSPVAPTVAESSSAPASKPLASSPGTGPAPSSSSSTSVPLVGPEGGPVPAGLRLADLSFVSDQLGWALGTAPCRRAP